VIHVSRPRKAPQAFLDAAREEMKQVVPLFRRAGGGKPKFAFRAYRTPELVRILEQLFFKKCAYCEGNYAATGYVEVEHYRPKSLYYWLAADWCNLLPSCKRCNNGKLSKFPLLDPRKQARRRGDEKRETPLLLDPCDPARTRRPERHLTFSLEDGTIQAVEMRGQPSAIGMASIEVYRLARPDLSQLRRDWAIRVKAQLRFCKLARRAGTAAEREAAYRGLKDLLEPTQPFRALTLAILRQSGVRTAGSG